MHGLIFSELKKFVDTHHGVGVWNDLITASGTNNKTFLPVKSYPDEELVAIVQKACEKTNTPLPEILDQFGQFLVPSLMRMYVASIKPEWRTLDLLEHTELTMHKAVRFSDKNAAPPALECVRVSPQEVNIIYRSPRKMVDLGLGLIKGISKHYQEKIDIQTETLDDIQTRIIIKAA